MAVTVTLLTLGCILASTTANPAQVRSDWEFQELEKELKGLFTDEEQKKTLDTRDVVEVDGVSCGWFETVTGKSLFGYNTKTLYDVTSEACMEACAYEYNFYCRSADFNEGSGTCYLSSESDVTQPHDFGDNFNTIYFRRHCDDPSTEESGSGWYYG